MKNLTHVLQFVLAALLVITLGGLAGWYLFVRQGIEDTQAADAARGAGMEVSFGSRLGSTYQNIVQGVSNALGRGDDAPTAEPSGGTFGGVSGFYQTVVDGIAGAFGGTTGSTTTEAKKNRAPRLWPVSKHPVAGMGFASTTENLFFAERASGNILLAKPDEQAIDRLTNTLVAKVHEAHFAADGSVILRSEDEGGAVVTFLGELSTTTTESASGTPRALVGVQLPKGVIAVAVRPFAKELFFLTPSAAGVSGITANWKGTNQKTVFTSAITHWRPRLLADGTITLAQPAMDRMAGHAYELAGGALKPIARNIEGLGILPREKDGALLYSVSDGALRLFARPTASASFVELPIKTVADKCVWSPVERTIAYCAVPNQAPTGEYLRNWYMGRLHTADAWFRVDVAAGTAERFFSTDSSVSFDVERPQINSAGTYLAFMNAADKSLWMLRIAE